MWTLVAAALAGMPAWRDAGPDARVGVCAEILHRLHQHIFELAHAVQCTTGQAFVMAFQAGGAHALDRALEALTYAYVEMTRTPARADWSKPGKRDPLRLTKTFHVVPRGVALVVGCNTFPTWNAYPGLFASLATGNPVVVKPHPRAVLPLAITVRHRPRGARRRGLRPEPGHPRRRGAGRGARERLAIRPEVRIVDFTGSTEYGDWLEANARQAAVYTEKAGVNTVVVDSTDDFAGMCRNLGFSLTLYSGQMCTTPQNVLIPATGIDTDQGHQSFDQVVAAWPRRSRRGQRPGPRGGTDRRDREPGGAGPDRPRSTIGEVVLESRPADPPGLSGRGGPHADDRAAARRRRGTYGAEWFGPISFVVATESTQDSLEISGVPWARGRPDRVGVLDGRGRAGHGRGGRAGPGVHLSANLTGTVYVNQSAAFSDFHASGAQSGRQRDASPTAPLWPTGFGSSSPAGTA